VVGLGDLVATVVVTAATHNLAYGVIVGVLVAMGG